ncbi:hypothetical protein LOTGIDRAFT_153336 [Lottia gigantea]|uniref:Uncharacterized protein n=1 Tax=Lottia gigantea TaxID=225164 RepID=V4AAR8_LOTGI|nr:hypothetical protein LOTGIDRAFT_153336 [Lottia gigantea]ESO93862.1 hypothetical protein LOTGIDRAFT_153336 [Lottia gigantea]
MDYNEVFAHSIQRIPASNHCAPLILSVPALAKRQNVTITAYDFSEAQAGKDICDRKIASLKAHIQRYINEDHNVTTASEMFDACRSYNGVRGCYVSVMNIDETVISERVTWTGITTMTNFTYEENGVRVWKAFGIGKGVLHSYDKLLRKNECNVRPMFTVVEYSTPQIYTGAAHRTTETLFSCSEQSKDDWLNSRQIASYFSRLAALQKCGHLDAESNKPATTIDVENNDCNIVEQVVERRRLRRRIISDLDE